MTDVERVNAKARQIVGLPAMSDTPRTEMLRAIRERYAEFVEGFPTANRTTLYQRALAFSEWLAQIAEGDDSDG